MLVSKESLERALQVASELFLALEDRGQHVVLAPAGSRYHHVTCKLRDPEIEPETSEHSLARWYPGAPTISVIGDVAIGLTLFEVSVEMEVRYDGTLKKSWYP